jgi:hypothetical protein
MKFTSELASNDTAVLYLFETIQKVGCSQLEFANNIHHKLVKEYMAYMKKNDMETCFSKYSQ